MASITAIWPGFNPLRGGQTQSIVGSHQQVAERLDDLAQLGADAFILASTPHLEEAYRVGEEVLLHLAAAVSVGFKQVHWGGIRHENA